MRPPTSRYRPDAPGDYSHRFHAGNVGDVWKHCVLVEVLRAAARGDRPVAYVDTHAGEGRYPLGPTGEWTEGIGRLQDAPVGLEGAAGRYVALHRRLSPESARPRTYPGSPLLALAALGREDTLALFERDVATHARLAAAVAGDPRVSLSCGDGLAALPDALERLAARGARCVALIDPPYSQKSDWVTVPDALVAAARRAPDAAFVLWYPVKSLTRPNAMLARVRDAGIAGALAELVTTPLEHQRHRLNGSGVVLVRPPAGVLASIAAALPVLGARCTTHGAAWSSRLVGW